MGWFRKKKAPQIQAVEVALDAEVAQSTIPTRTPSELSAREAEGRPLYKAAVDAEVVTDAIILDAVDVVRTHTSNYPDDEDLDLAAQYDRAEAKQAWTAEDLKKLLEHVTLRHAQLLTRFEAKQTELDVERTRSESYNRQLVEARSKLNGLLPIKQFPMVGYHIDGRTIQIENAKELKTLTAKQLLGDPEAPEPTKKRQAWFTHPDQAIAAREAVYGVREVKSLPARLKQSAQQDELDAELRHSRQSTLVRHSLKESSAPKKFEKMTAENFDGDITVKRGTVQRQLPKGSTA